MRNPARIKAKVKQDLAMNLSELAAATGWDRNTLAAMHLPLQNGKIIYSDFRRVLHRRQDAHEDSLSKMSVVIRQPVSSETEDERSRQAVADKFYAPSQKNANKAA